MVLYILLLIIVENEVSAVSDFLTPIILLAQLSSLRREH